MTLKVWTMEMVKETLKSIIVDTYTSVGVVGTLTEHKDHWVNSLINTPTKNPNEHTNSLNPKMKRRKRRKPMLNFQRVMFSSKIQTRDSFHTKKP
jgi:hypothetical protein